MHQAAAVHRSLQFRLGYRLCRSFRSLSLEEIEKECRNRRLSPSPPLSRNLRALTGGASLPSHGLHLRWDGFPRPLSRVPRSEEHTSELQSLMRISYAVF